MWSNMPQDLLFTWIMKWPPRGREILLREQPKMGILLTLTREPPQHQSPYIQIWRSAPAQGWSPSSFSWYWQVLKYLYTTPEQRNVQDINTGTHKPWRNGLQNNEANPPFNQGSKKRRGLLLSSNQKCLGSIHMPSYDGYDQYLHR